MSLIACPGCGNMNSPTAPACPACGRVTEAPAAPPSVPFRVSVGRKPAVAGSPARVEAVEFAPGSFRQVPVAAVLPQPEGPLSIVLEIVGADPHYLPPDVARKMAEAIVAGADAFDQATSGAS